MAYFEGTLGSGVTILYTSPLYFNTAITGLSFNNPLAYDITLTVNRANPVSNTDRYSFVLAAGDVIQDTTLYRLGPGDSLSVNITAAGTNCFFNYDSVNTIN